VVPDTGVPAARDDSDRRPDRIQLRPVVPPEVTIGNGRAPQISGQAPAQWTPPVGPTVPVSLPPAAAPPAQAAPPARPLFAGLRTARLDMAALHRLPSTRPGHTMTSLFGLAGLLLIPLAGAALGYRQARAARALTHT
jgi:hypothetical protein